MTACRLFSDTQPQLVARVLNNSLKDKLLSVNLFLSMVEPVQCLSGTGYEPSSLIFDGSSSNGDSMLFEEYALPVSSSPLSTTMSAEGVALRASSVSATTVEVTASGSSPPSPSEGQLYHIESLLRSLPHDLTLNGKLLPNPMLEVHGPSLQLSEHLLDTATIARKPAGLASKAIPADL